MSRVYEDKPNTLGFDMGEKADGSWLRADAIHGCVAFDMSSMDGELILSPRHAEALGARLLLWADANGTPREQHMLRVIDEMVPSVTAASGVLGVADDAAWRARAMAARDIDRDRRLGWPGHLLIWVVVAIAFVIPAALHGLDAPAAPVTLASSAAPAQGPGVGAGADGGGHFDWLGLVVGLAVAVVSLAGSVGFCVMYVAGIKAAAAAAQAEALAAKAKAEAAHEAIAAQVREFRGDPPHPCRSQPSHGRRGGRGESEV